MSEFPYNIFNTFYFFHYFDYLSQKCISVKYRTYFFHFLVIAALNLGSRCRRLEGLIVPCYEETIYSCRSQLGDSLLVPSMNAQLTVGKLRTNVISVSRLCQLQLIVMIHIPFFRGGRKSPIQFGKTHLHSCCIQHTFYCIIYKQTPFKITSTGVQGYTPMDFHLK